MSEYVEFLKEVFEQFGPIHPRRMFGGHGLFHKGVMFYPVKVHRCVMDGKSKICIP
ncbi:MAG: TfoX/Sxy family protein [Nitrospirota bacterium]